MARPKTVLVTERLRDQVYRLIRSDLADGELGPGARIVELDLAERYKVSRTPVREALLQLSREGLVIPAPERGYIVAVDTPMAMACRHEVRDLIDPQVARHASLDGTPEQKAAFAQAHDRQRAAHESGQVQDFIEANESFRNRLRGMCDNATLVQCSALVDDQAQWARRAAFRRPDYRAAELEHDARLVVAIAQGDAAGAEAAVRAYIDMVRTLHEVTLPAADEPA